MERFAPLVSPIQAFAVHAEVLHDNNQPGTRILNFFSAYLNQFAIARAVPTNVPDPVKPPGTALHTPDAIRSPATKSGDWKATLRSKLQTKLHDWHARAPGFEKLFAEYVSSEPVEGRQCLNRLVGKCMALPEPYVLKEILANELVERLYIEGPVDARGWETLIAAMPADFPVQALKLSIMRLDHSEAGLLLKALCGMPKLKELRLYMVGVEGEGIPSEWPEGLAFEALEFLEVTTSSVPEVDACELPRAILEGCHQLRSLSLQDYGAITPDQHASLAETLGRQRLLNSLKLIIEKPCSMPKQLDCYMPFLCGQAPFTSLSLDGWELEAGNFNRLLAALRDKPTLTSLSLCNFTFLKETESGPVQILPLAGMRKLLDLDLGWNPFDDSTLTQLLHAFKKEPTSLMYLGLNGNSIGSSTLAALAALLKANRTLIECSLQRAVVADPAGWRPGALEALAQAFEASTSLQRFRVRWSDIPEACHARLVKSLERNRRSFVANGMWGALNSVHPGFPKDLANLIFEQGLTRPDAVRMSSVNKAGWNARRGPDDPSK